MSDNGISTHVLSDGRLVTVTELGYLDGWQYRAVFSGDPGSPFGHGDTVDEAATDLLLQEFRETARCQWEARQLTGLGDEEDLPPGYRSYVHHLDGNPRNNELDNLVVVHGSGNGQPG